MALLCAGVLGADPLDRGIAAADPAASSAEDAVVAGRTVAEWQQWFKEIDLSGPEAAAAVGALIAIVQDQTAAPQLRQQAALTLGRIGPAAASAVSALTDLLETATATAESDSPRHWGLKGLALLGPVAAESAPRVIAILQDPASTRIDRLLSLEALGRIGSAHPQTLATIVAVLQGRLAGSTTPPSRDAEAELRELRVAAADVLTLFGTAAAPAIPALLEALRSEDEPLRRVAATSLGATTNPIVLDSLVDVLQFDESPAVRDAAASAIARLGRPALPVLSGLLRDTDPEIRSRAADGLRRIGAAALPAAPALKERLQDESPVVRLAAAEAIWTITSDAAASYPTALTMLTEPDRVLRMRAHRLILEIGRRASPPELLAELERLASSRDPRVRQAAFIALREITQQAP